MHYSGGEYESPRPQPVKRNIKPRQIVSIGFALRVNSHSASVYLLPSRRKDEAAPMPVPTVRGIAPEVICQILGEISGVPSLFNRRLVTRNASGVTRICMGE